jgi:hypothetical protein
MGNARTLVSSIMSSLATGDDDDGYVCDNPPRRTHQRFFHSDLSNPPELVGTEYHAVLIYSIRVFRMLFACKE